MSLKWYYSVECKIITITKGKTEVLKMKKQINALLLILVIFVLLCGCGNNDADSCKHNYYVSDYSAPTANDNGYNKYTCSKCGDSYTEVIAKLSADSSTDSSTAQDDYDSSGGHKKDNRTINLFELPVYSSRRSNGPDFYADCEDDAGYRHSNCYKMFSDSWVRYDLDGNYSKLHCKLYANYNIQGEIAVKFYDGEEFLGSTPKLSSNNTSVEFELDITGVKYLTVECEDGAYNDQIIFDPITISK